MKATIRQRATLARWGKIVAFATAILGVTKLTLEFATLTSASTAAFGFLIVVLLSAFFGDLAVASATSVVATLCFNYFYLPPTGTFSIAALSDWISLAAFLLASVIVSRLTASAAKHASEARLLNRTLVQLTGFGERLLSLPYDQLTLSGMAGETVRAFALEYCSIHVYGEGKWRHFSGAATDPVSEEIEVRLKWFQDHATDVMELADESLLGVRYMQIDRGSEPLAVLAVKSGTLPDAAIGTIAYMIGVQLRAILNEGRLPART